MTPAEFELLGGMQAWADRNADAIGKALAEHTFSAGPAGGFLREYAERQGHRGRRLKKGWGSAQAGHFKDIFKRGRRSPAASASSTSKACSASARCTAKINLPLKWFLGTYPVFIDLVHEAMLADVPEPARVEKKRFGRSAESIDHAGPGRRRARAEPRSSTTTRRRSSRPSTTTRSRRWA